MCWMLLSTCAGRGEEKWVGEEQTLYCKFQTIPQPKSSCTHTKDKCRQAGAMVGIETGKEHLMMGPCCQREKEVQCTPGRDQLPVPESTRLLHTFHEGSKVLVQFSVSVMQTFAGFWVLIHFLRAQGIPFPSEGRIEKKFPKKSFTANPRSSLTYFPREPITKPNNSDLQGGGKN